MKEFIVSNMYVWMLIALIPWAIIAKFFTKRDGVAVFLLAIQFLGLVLQITSFILDI